MMSEYKVVRGRHGNRYMKDGRFVAKANLPADVLQELGIDIPTPEATFTERDPKKCIFCGAYTNWSRLVNLQTVAVCENDYYAYSIGKIAQKLNQGQPAG